MVYFANPLEMRRQLLRSSRAADVRTCRPTSSIRGGTLTAIFDSDSVQRLPTIAFGYTFTHIAEHVREDLDSLERECVVYSDHWIDELKDFRHVRIAFTVDEAKEFAKRC
jgi:hypothetical protein